MDRQFFKKYLAQTTQNAMSFPITRAEGHFLYDDFDNKYIDLIGGISVSSIGHSHPEVVKAIQKQAAAYLHVMVYGEAILSPQIQYAKLLTDHLPTHLDNVYFTNSGAEAVEGAMKLAKRYTGKTDIIACNHSYHGSTQGALSVFGDEAFRNAFRPLLPGIRHIQHGNTQDLQYITPQTAAVIIEVIQAEAGCLIPNKEWLIQLRNRCNETQTLLIFDEIQSGFGRTGTLWAFEDYGVYPDILLLGKALGGGMPLGAFIAPKNIMNTLTYQPILGHMTTFGGHPVSCAAGMASLKVLLEQNIVATVKAKEILFRSLLIHPKIKSISGKGLMMAIELDSFELVTRLIEIICLKNSTSPTDKIGVFTDWFLFAPNCIRIVPPLNIDDESIRIACHIILEALNEIP
jgi:acetylornithine/N-succinyldiaminopimelate aminotransferase